MRTKAPMPARTSGKIAAAIQLSSHSEHRTNNCRSTTSHYFVHTQIPNATDAHSAPNAPQSAHLSFPSWSMTSVTELLVRDAKLSAVADEQYLYQSSLIATNHDNGVFGCSPSSGFPCREVVRLVCRVGLALRASTVRGDGFTASTKSDVSCDSPNMSFSSVIPLISCGLQQFTLQSTIPRAVHCQQQKASHGE